MEVMVLFWLGLSVGVAMIARNRGRRSWLWFLLAMVASPLLAFAVLMLMVDLKVQDFVETVSQSIEATHVRCPHCAEYVLPEASVCKYCKGKLVPQDSTVFHDGVKQKIDEEVAQIKASEYNVMVVGGAAIGFGILVWLIFG